MMKRLVHVVCLSLVAGHLAACDRLTASAVIPAASASQSTPPATSQPPTKQVVRAPPPADLPVGRRPYMITIVSADLAPSKPNGKPWDADGGGPDTVVTVMVAGAGKGTVVSTKASDTTSPYWGQRGQVTLNRGDGLKVKIVDKDILADDPIASWEFEFVSAGRRTLSDAASGVNSIVIDIQEAR